MGMLFGRPAASFDDPLGMLAACHERVRKNVETLGRITTHVSLLGVDKEASTAAAAVHKYFSTAAHQHHLDEELDVFPCVRRRVNDAERAELLSIMEQIEQEHEVIEGLWAQMEPALLAVSEGQQAEIPADVVDEFVTKMRAHLDVEERQLLPRAHAFIQADDLPEIGKNMALRRGLSWPVTDEVQGVVPVGN